MTDEWRDIGPIREISSPDLARAPSETVVTFIRDGKVIGRVDERDGVPICRDLDEDCSDLDHLTCYLHDPAKGRCPFLSRCKKPNISR